MKITRRQKAPRADRGMHPTGKDDHSSDDRLRDGPAGAIQGFVLIAIGMILAHIFTS
jgi:hypothetical protein